MHMLSKKKKNMPLKVKKVKVAHSCPTLCDTMDCVACQASPLSVGFLSHEYWSGLPFPSPGDPPDLGIEPGSPAFQIDSLLSETLGKPLNPCPVSQLCQVEVILLVWPLLCAKLYD